ncbi:Gfo/Idh/MocA family oxidoreductase [Candidatus Pelagibacter sp.]|nr:Gfo/Idh/MocA family oxidoreductase [Candidatus Pelagibacter sp.]
MKKYVVVGFGTQGKKRTKFFKRNQVIIVDPYKKNSDYKDIKYIPKNIYNNVLICTPNNQKEKIIKYCLLNNKNFLVEKPFPLIDNKKMKFYSTLIKKKKLVGYVAYNHRFEPHFEKIKKILKKNKIGKVYSCRLFYGNGTSTLVKNSPWRDKGLGVISDLGSHLLDICNFWFNVKTSKIDYIKYNKFENKSADHAKILFFDQKIFFDLEMTLCMWRNHFTCDILGKKGSLHISSLCKWDETILTVREKVFPSGIPKQKIYKLKMKDPTWEKEHRYFKQLVTEKKFLSFERDIWINKIFKNIRLQKYEKK